MLIVVLKVQHIMGRVGTKHVIEELIKMSVH